jgi:hypothetical protein
MNSSKGSAGATLHEQLDTYNSFYAMQKIFVLWMKDGFALVTGENLLGEMMKYKPARITRIK